jgi:hypothetical protein
MMVDLDRAFTTLLGRDLAEGRRATGDRFTTCERMLPVLGPSPPATEEEMTWPPAQPTTIETTPELSHQTETIAELSQSATVKPWKAAGMSRASWYRRQARGSAVMES